MYGDAHQNGEIFFLIYARGCVMCSGHGVHDRRWSDVADWLSIVGLVSRDLHVIPWSRAHAIDAWSLPSGYLDTAPVVLRDINDDITGAIELPRQGKTQTLT